MSFGWREVIKEAPSAARVLVVDDDPGVRRVLSRLVGELGHTAKAAGSSEEADHWLAAERFDLLLLDVQLPKMSGLEFLQWALDRDPEMAIIMVTGLDDAQLAVECMDHGARNYLVKPINFDFLRVAVRDALAVRRLLVELNAGPAGAP